MKRLALFSCVIALLLGMIGCGKETTSPSSEPIVSTSEVSIPSSIPESSQENTSSAMEEESIVSELPTHVADAAMYRGHITHISKTENGTVYSLEQAPGTDFGATTVDILLDHNTKTNFEPETAKTGDYLEVFYGSPTALTENKNEPIPAIAINYLDKHTIINGTVVEVVLDTDKIGLGHFVITDEQTQQNVNVFFDRDANQFYLDFDSIQSGSKLSLLTFPSEQDPTEYYLVEARLYVEK